MSEDARIYNLYLLECQAANGDIHYTTICSSSAQRIIEVRENLKTFDLVRVRHYEMNEQGQLSCIEYHTFRKGANEKIVDV